MTLTESKLKDDNGDCPVVRGILVEDSPPAASAPPAPEPAAAREFSSTSTQRSGLHGATYFKSPTADMLQQARHTRGSGGGVLFITIPIDFRGKFTVPKSIKLGHILSGDKIDLSRADFVHPVTNINAGEILGGLEVSVQMKGIGILGDFRYRHRGQTVGAEQDAPLIVLTGFSLLGGVEVKVNESVPPVRVVQ